MILYENVLNREDSLNRLKENGLVTLGGRANDFLFKDDEAEYTPWFMRLFIGASAWMSATLFIIFLFAVKVLSENSALTFGVLFLTVAVVLSRLGERRDFLNQLSIALNFSGHACVITGFIPHHLALWKILLIFIFIEFLLFLLFKDILQKFLSAFYIPFLFAFVLHYMTVIPQ